MAGSPGAGKTESSIALIESLSGPDTVLRIDIDDLRKEFRTYDGKNSSLFQAGSVDYELRLQLMVIVEYFEEMLAVDATPPSSGVMRKILTGADGVEKNVGWNNLKKIGTHQK
jgi:hypothetical protein